jgi:hypothetical protein
VESRVTGANTDNENIVINVLSDGTYGGTLRLAAGTGTGKDNGILVIRGVGTQTFTGTFLSPDSPVGTNPLQIQKDISVGKSVTVSIAGNASLAQQSATGAVLMGGGTFKLDNSAGSLNRLRDGAASPVTTGLDDVGGGLFSLIGNLTGTQEIISRLQLGTPTKPRAGALKINVQQPAGATARTELGLQSLTRDGATPTFATVDFTANDNAGNELSLGAPGSRRASHFSPRRQRSTGYCAIRVPTLMRPRSAGQR